MVSLRKLEGVTKAQADVSCKIPPEASHRVPRCFPSHTAGRWAFPTCVIVTDPQAYGTLFLPHLIKYKGVVAQQEDDGIGARAVPKSAPIRPTGTLSTLLGGVKRSPTKGGKLAARAATGGLTRKTP